MANFLSASYHSTDRAWCSTTLLIALGVPTLSALSRLFDLLDGLQRDGATVYEMLDSRLGRIEGHLQSRDQTDSN